MNKFEEVKSLFSRADEHLDWLRKYVVHPDPKLLAHNRGFYIVPESGDYIAGKIRIVIGEFASCQRNGLNYLTCAVAEQDSGVASNSVQFPLESSPDKFRDRRTRFLRGVADEHVAFFERLQPYNTGKPFDLLRDLSNAYRHRELIRIEKQFQDTKLATPPPHTFRVPAGHKMRVEYFEIAVSLADGSPIVQVLEEIERRVRQAVVEFREPLKKYIRQNCIDF